MGKQDFARFGFKMRFGQISHLEQGPRILNISRVGRRGPQAPP